MKIQSATDFVEAVVQIWPPFRWDEVQERAWAELMARELIAFKPAVLERGFQEMVRRRKETRIPTPAECIAACVEARKWLEMEENDGKLPGLRVDPRNEWSSERVRLAYDLIKSGMGKQAAQDDPCWVLALWHFCRRNQKLPSGHAIEQCKKDAREFDEAYQDVLRGEAAGSDGVIGDLPNALALQKLGASIIAKRNKMAEEVLGQPTRLQGISVN